jgi:hypothetical protein
MWMMLYYLATHRGFWAPVGYIGHVVVRTAHITSAGPVAAGIVIHMMVSMMLGALVAQAFRPAGLALSMGRGIAVGLVVWVVMQYGFIHAVDGVAFRGLIPAAFAVGHIVYGATLGLVAARTSLTARLPVGATN